jgi:sialidase-1
MRLRARAALAVGTLLAAVVAAPSAAAPAAAADTCTTTLWQAGTGGYAAYRIPAVINAGGTLLAFAEGRRNSSADGGDIEIVQRRSTDGGCTWTPQQVVADAWTDSVDQPVPMVTDAGTVVLMTNWQRGTVTQDDIQAGIVPPEDGRRVFVQTSADRGVTWTRRREVTASVKRPEWRWFASGPGHGVTIARGKALGRLVAAGDHTLTSRNERGIETLISDDDGQTWRLGGIDDHSAADDPMRPDETTAAELPDGRLYFSSRNVDGTLLDPPLGRGYTYSLNSGSSFSAPVRPMPAIVAPEAEGSVLQDPGYPAGVTCAPLLYSGPEDPLLRRHLTVRRSDDGGLTWRDIAEITDATTPAAYSDMVKVSRTQLGILYETWSAPGAPARIDWQQITLGCP